MLRLRHLFVSAFALACLLAAPQVRAATVLAMDLAALVHASDYVVLANATAAHARYRDSDGLIVTDVTLRVARTLRGDVKAGGMLTATHLGGSVEDVGLNVPGEASFELGRSAIVFLRRTTQSDNLYVVGMSQGVLPVTGAVGTEQVLPAGQNAELVTRDANGKLVDARGALTEAKPLREVLAQLSQLIAQDHAR